MVKIIDDLSTNHDEDYRKHLSSMRGGKRPGAGRKKLANPKMPITTYHEKNKIEQVGGREAAKGLIVMYINNLPKSL